MSTYKPTGKTYRLSTIHDIYEQLTADQIKVCMSELSILLSTNKAFTALLNETSAALLGTKNDTVAAFALPEFFEWHDDGKGSIKIEYSFDGVDESLMLRIQTKEAP